MATLVLSAAGGALGGTLFGGVGLVLGRAAGAAVGYVVDQSLFGTHRKVEGPRLSDLDVQSSTEGVPLPRVYGRMRMAGQIIWATRFEEVKTTETETTGGKGGGGGTTVTTVDYSYYANFAVAICEGPIARIGRIWADGELIDQAAATIRVYLGTEDQDADGLILAKQGGAAPAYRGTAYVVFERLPIGEYGNRLPQLTFEVFRPLSGIEDHVRAVCVIPGSTEFGYDTEAVSVLLAPGVRRSENAHAERERTDWTVSIDELQTLCPALQWVSLIVAWFGDDLRCGSCTVRPKVDTGDKQTEGASWSVAGLTRGTADEVTTVEGRPAFGGTPSDQSVIRAIADLKGRGLKVLLAPFLLMDVPDGNSLPDPETGDPGQPAYPWRGAVTCDPAPGVPGTVDKTAAAATQVSDFLGTAAPTDFSVSPGSVTYTGPAEWRYRRLVLHYAALAEAAGGVDAFVLGSEMRGVSTVRGAANAFPFVDGLVTLAADVRDILDAGTKVSYGADWSEYFGHQPADGTGDVFFHLDPLWASADVDFVGIDNYFPLADWRDGTGHADTGVGRSIYDLDYLRANVRGGEGFDWYYASDADRLAQTRTPISDGAYSKPWVFRFKDLEAWWANAHYDRPGGVESGTPTAWLAEGKPIWFTEIGCPAVDKGANQPNVFVDEKSAFSALPHFSSGARDDTMQRRYLEAVQTFFDTGYPDFSGSNPVSGVYGKEMVDPAHLHVWAWDARPFPHFPLALQVWSDGVNWARGHWLNGRLGANDLALLIAAILADYGATNVRVEDVNEAVGGYVINRTLSARAALEPLLRVFAVDAGESGENLLFRGRGRPADLGIVDDDLVDAEGAPLVRRMRAQETELPSEIVLRHIDPERDYRVAAAASRRLIGQSRRTGEVDLAAVLSAAEAEARAQKHLTDIWTGREAAEFDLPPRLAAIEAGDIINLDLTGAVGAALVTRIEDRGSRAISAVRIDTGRFAVSGDASGIAPDLAPVWGAPEVRVLDIAPPPDGADAHAPRIAVFADPWPGTMGLYRAAEGGGYRLAGLKTLPATIGETLTALGTGPTAIFDRGTVLDVKLYGGALSALPEIDVLAGGNLAAVRADTGEWELIQFADAELIGEDTWRLTKLLRGLGGSKAAIAAGAGAGADFVRLDEAVTALPVGAESLGLPLSWRVGPAQDNHGAATYRTLEVTAAGAGLRPFSPVHLAARRDAASGDVALSWVRRTRFGGDSWAAVEVPLNEATEAYRLEILDGAAVVRTVETAAPAYLYTDAEQMADFGSPPDELTIRVAQLSAVVGAGRAAEATLAV